MDLRKDVLYYDALVDFPAIGQEDKLYLNKADGSLYYWDGAAYQLAGDGSGGVTSVTASAPLASSGGATPNITLSVPSDNTKFLDGTGAFDTVKDSDLSLSDITTNDVSTSKHGFAPKAPNDTTKFLRGDGTWAVPAGGGLTKFTEAENTSAPNGTVYVDSLTAAASSTNADFAILPKGNGAILADIPDNTTAGGNKRGQYATDLQGGTRLTADQVASGDYSVISGGVANKASGAASFCGGGYYNQSTNSHSVVAGGNQNVASGDKSTITGGSNSTASGSYSYIGGGISNSASAYSAFIPAGYGNVASNNYAMAIGFWNTSSGSDSGTFGKYNIANSTNGYAIGQYASTLSIKNRIAIASGNFASVGDCQISKFILKVATTGNTATDITTDGGGYSNGSNNYIALSNQSAYRFKGTIVGKQSGSTNAAVWDVDGFIVRGANAAATTLVVGNVNVIDNTPAWGTPTLAADTTIGCLQVRVTGAAATNIRWIANIETTEVIYA